MLISEALGYKIEKKKPNVKVPQDNGGDFTFRKEDKKEASDAQH